MVLVNVYLELNWRRNKGIYTMEQKKLLDDCLCELENTIYTEEELIYCVTQIIQMYLKRTF